MVKFGNQKNVFWEALLIAVVVFFFGLLIGASFEKSRIDEMNEYYRYSEVALMDVLALSEVISSEDGNCEALVSANLKFADKIYEESVLLEKYETAEKMEERLQIVHKKYDLLRTFLWMNNMEIRKKCKSNFSSVVYLYEYGSDDLVQKATQNVWSKVLFDLKQEMGDQIILIPIAANINLTSLDTLMERFEISEFPVVIINDKYVLKELTSAESLKEYLN